jgi:hypothetical protein
MPRRAAIAAGFAVAALTVAALTTAMPACAQLLGPNLAPPPAAVIQPADPGMPSVPPVRAPVDDRIAFNAAETWMIPHYFDQVRDKQKRAARSKKYPRDLPEGIASDPAKGDLLPLPVLARLERLPAPLLRDLPPNRPDTDRVVVGKNVLMVRRSTGEVLDILPNILF